MPIVLLGNHAALDHKGNVVEGQQVTLINIPEQDTHQEGFRTITHEDGLWRRIAAEDAAWVASDSERMAQALAAHFGCPIVDLDEGHAKYAHALSAAAQGMKPEDLDPAETPAGAESAAPAGAGDGGELE